MISRSTVSLAALLLATAACGDSGTDGGGGSAAETSSSSSSSGDTTSAGGAGQGGSTSDGGGGAAAAPSIDEVNPPVAKVTTSISILGAAFGAEQGASEVRLGGVLTAATSWSDTEIELDVPYELVPGDYDVVVTTAGGSSNAGALEVVLPRTVYVNEESSPNRVSAFALDADGTLTPIPGSPFPTNGDAPGFGGDSSSIVADRTTRRLFASNNGGIAVFDVHAATGALTHVAGSPFTVCTSRVFGLAVTADGTVVYGACYDSQEIVAMAVDAGTGALSHVEGSPFAVGGNVDTPTLLHGDTVLAANDEDSQLFTFTLDGAGALTAAAGSPVATPSAYTSIGSPDGTRVYVPSSELGVFDVSTAGVTTPITGSPFTFPDLGAIHPLAFRPDGAILVGGDSASLHVLAVDGDGAPTPIDGSPFAIPSGYQSGSSWFSRDGSLLAVLHEGVDAISVFAMAPDGTPTEAPGSPFPRGEATDASGLLILE